MDIIKLSDNSIRIKAKNTSIAINPGAKIDSDVVMLTALNVSDFSKFNDKVVISGPGEYEISGVSIKGERVDGKLWYSLLEENQRLLLLSTPSLAKNEETEGYTATLVLLDAKVDDVLSTIASDVTVISGNEEFLPADKSSLKKIDKLNLRKLEDYKGSIIYLSR